MYNEKVNTLKLKKIIDEQNLLKDKKNILALGIDQGYANLGFALVKYNVHTDKYKVLTYGTITTPSKDKLEYRLLQIYDKLELILNQNNIDLIGCEALFANGDRRASGNKVRNKSSSIVNTSMSTGVIHLLSAKNNIEIKMFPPTTIKKQLTGNGRAEKDDIINVVEDLMAKQDLKVKTNHESDAIAIGITTISTYIERLLQ